jgi:hypothetical protein
MKNNNILIIALVVAVVLLLLNTCRMSKNYKNTLSEIDQMALNNQKLDSLVNSQGEIIYTQESIIADNTDAIDNLTDTIFDLKRKDERNTKTIAYYKGITSIQADSIKVPYLDTVAMREFSEVIATQCKEVIEYMQTHIITVPRKAPYSSDSISFVATINRDNMILDSLRLPDTLQLRFVEHGGFLKKKSIEVQFFHTNPLFRTQSSNSVFYQPKKKSFFTRVLLPVAIGVGIGVVISK